MTKVLRFCNHRSSTRLATSQLTLRSVPLLLVRWEWQWIMVLSSTNTYTCIVLVHEIMKTFLERYLARRESGDQVEQISTPSVFFLNPRVSVHVLVHCLHHSCKVNYMDKQLRRYSSPSEVLRNHTIPCILHRVSPTPPRFLLSLLSYTLSRSKLITALCFKQQEGCGYNIY